MMSVREMLLKGDFNSMTQLPHTDGFIKIILTKMKDKSMYVLYVKDLYKPTEVVLKEEIISG